MTKPKIMPAPGRHVMTFRKGDGSTFIVFDLEHHEIENRAPHPRLVLYGKIVDVRTGYSGPLRKGIDYSPIRVPNTNVKLRSKIPPPTLAARLKKQARRVDAYEALFKKIKQEADALARLV